MNPAQSTCFVMQVKMLLVVAYFFEQKSMMSCEPHLSLIKSGTNKTDICTHIGTTMGATKDVRLCLLAMKCLHNRKNSSTLLGRVLGTSDQKLERTS